MATVAGASAGGAKGDLVDERYVRDVSIDVTAESGEKEVMVRVDDSSIVRLRLW